jgi:hypothetical protein
MIGSADRDTEVMFSFFTRPSIIAYLSSEYQITLEEH